MEDSQVLKLFKAYVGKGVKVKDLIVANDINDNEYIIMEKQDLGRVWIMTLTNNGKVEGVLEL